MSQQTPEQSAWRRPLTPSIHSLRMSRQHIANTNANNVVGSSAGIISPPRGQIAAPMAPSDSLSRTAM